MSSRWPQKQLIIRRTASGRSLSFRLLAKEWMRPLFRHLHKLAENYWEQPSPQSKKTFSRWFSRMDYWGSTPIRDYTRALVLNLEDIPAASPEQKVVVIPDGMVNFARWRKVKEVYHQNLRGKRVLAIAAGGLGDLILFSQVFRILRERHQATIDVLSYADGHPTDLIELLYQPAELHMIPLSTKIWQSYDFVWPLGMYKIIIGETPSEYFYRSLGVKFRLVGFPADADTDDRVDILFRHRHGFDLERDRLIFIQAACSGQKNYPHMETVAEMLIARGHKVVLIGGLRDSKMSDRPGILANLCGTKVWTTIRAMRHAAVVLTPDSCFLHAAGVWQKPTLALFGPTSTLWSEPYPSVTAVTYSTTCWHQPCWAVLDDVPPCGVMKNRPCLEQMPPSFLADLVERKLNGRLNDRRYDIPLLPKYQFVG